MIVIGGAEVTHLSASPLGRVDTTSYRGQGRFKGLSGEMTGPRSSTRARPFAD